jgi:hypothetical protein
MRCERRNLIVRIRKLASAPKHTTVDTRALETDEGTVADTCPLRGWCVTVDTYYDVSLGMRCSI